MCRNAGAVTFRQRFRIKVLVLAAQFWVAVQREAEESARIRARAAPATVNGRLASKEARPLAKPSH
jgi:hypothetical protein